MIFLTSRQLRRLDRLATLKYGIPSLILMENAGIACADEILKRFKLRKGSRVLIFCGPGNNGGDGFVVARQLFNKGLQPVVFTFQKETDMKPDSRANFVIVKKLGIKIVKQARFSRKLLESYKKGAKLIVDALFGIGLSRPLSSPYSDLIPWINKAGIPVVAVDVPSGMNSDTGAVPGECVKAGLTVTFAAPKKGFQNRFASTYLGRWVVKDISLPL